MRTIKLKKSIKILNEEVSELVFDENKIKASTIIDAENEFFIGQEPIPGQGVTASSSYCLHVAAKMLNARRSDLDELSVEDFQKVKTYITGILGGFTLEMALEKVFEQALPSLLEKLTPQSATISESPSEN